MADVRQAYQIERRLDWLGDVADETPQDEAYAVHMDEARRALVTQALAREAEGMTRVYALAVIAYTRDSVFEMDAGRLHYRALPAKDAPPQACGHAVRADGFAMAQIYAVQEHRRRCLGSEMKESVATILDRLYAQVQKR